MYHLYRHYNTTLKEAAVKDYLAGKAVWGIFAKSIKYGIQGSSGLGLRCIMVIETLRSRLEEALAKRRFWCNVVKEVNIGNAEIIDKMHLITVWI